jgi:hypothetical protein
MNPSSRCGDDGMQPCARVGPLAGAVSASLDRVVVGGWDDRTVRYIDTSTNEIVASVGVANPPFGISQLLNVSP